MYPLIHEAMLPLMARWLKHKRLYGSPVEKAMYKDMSLIQLIHRLLDKRAVVFCGSEDRWKLIDNKNGVDSWESVGTDREKEPLVSASNKKESVSLKFYAIRMRYREHGSFKVCGQLIRSISIEKNGSNVKTRIHSLLRDDLYMCVCVAPLRLT